MQDRRPQRWRQESVARNAGKQLRNAPRPSDGRQALLQAAGCVGHPRAVVDLQILMVLHWAHFTLKRLNFFIHSVQGHNQNIT